ncbi:MAG: hypothetical protein AAF658_07940, partial [Myxococcota bacterium]
MLLSILTGLAVPACFVVPGRECGFGTELRNGECVTQSACGPGTRFEDGQCVQRSTGSITCAPGTQVGADGDCELDPDFCPPPGQFDLERLECLAPTQIVCGEGTEAFGSTCIPSCERDFEVQNLERDGCVPAYRVQVVHA